MIEGAAHLESFLAALHMHNLTAAEVAADLLYRIDANHGGAMDLPEFVRVQLIDQLFDRLADQGLETLRLYSRVFVLGAEEQDFARGDHPYIGADARQVEGPYRRVRLNAWLGVAALSKGNEVAVFIENAKFA